MYLKKIIASGFKSFADKIVIDLSKGITGIVGPNGSGKSNVVDAVRWVLGEQSIKSLRGDASMSDVIFAGSKSRNGMNMASVTLVFDNTDRYLNLDYSEVSIKRRVYRDGTNEYAINDERCRLKDVTDLFLDSGIAKESFNVISQGKVEEIISSKPENRRIVFEEAARVLKYKRRKEEAFHKLEKTHDNEKRIDDIIKELSLQITPLLEQRNKALEYQSYMASLEKVEVALFAHDIQKMNLEYQVSKKRMDALNEEIIQLSSLTASKEATVVKLKKEILSMEEEMNRVTKEIMEQAEHLQMVSNKKTVLAEKQKYSSKKEDIHTKMLSLKEEEMKLQVEISTLQGEIHLIEEQIDHLQEEIEIEEKNKNVALKNKENYQNKLTSLMKENYYFKNQVTTLKDSIDNNDALPSGVKAVLNHPKLVGIHNVVGSLLEMDEKFVTAITTSLGSASNYVVVDDEKVASSAIAYLKENQLGRVTFLPLSIIKGKKIEERIKENMFQEPGFVGIASELVHFNPKYKNIIENQLGNVLVTSTLEHANVISRKIEHKYKIVTLEGELLHVGGSVTGGSIPRMKNVIREKYELEEVIKKLEYNEKNVKEFENKINEVDYTLKAVEDKVYLATKKKMEKTETVSLKENYLKEKQERLEEVKIELEGNAGVLKNTLTMEEEKTMQDYYKVLEEKRKTEYYLETLKTNKKQMSERLEDAEFTSKRENSLISTKSKELNALEIERNRMDVKLDTLLVKLSETYAMTYENAILHYHLDMEEDRAREEVQRLKDAIRNLGVVNILAIEEYEKVNERYAFLCEQQKDLKKAEETLLEIIDGLDKVMEEEFSKTFEIIRQNFKTTFKELFKGGDADLKFTEPENMLETGIEIVASPPGKKLKSISFLSGGEKTFTAISLLFAILKSRPVPYCILDEVEAALDEVNVDSFGEYLNKLKEKTQFILITHKKKTMEYADDLYGITMQESGVSKLVSVKLEEVRDA